MAEYYFDDNQAVAYKVYPVTAAEVPSEHKEDGRCILVHTNIKATNFKKEKTRRMVSQVYPINKYDFDTALEHFKQTTLAKVLTGLRAITEEEYKEIKNRVEPLKM